MDRLTPRPVVLGRFCRPGAVTATALRQLRRFLLLLIGLLLPLVLVAQPVWAGPVDWQEVPATADGRQWWDAGSLRFSRDGYLTLLSRYQPAPVTTVADAGSTLTPEPAARPPASTLYVMDIDCDESLYRDRSVNGLHQFSPQWQAALADDLIGEVIAEACAAASRPGQTAAA
jgi:hypothetical protein